MALLTPKGQLKYVLSCFYNEGVLDRRQFEQVRGLQDDDNPLFIADLLTVYCEESNSIYSEIDQLLKRPAPDFQRIVAHVHHLKGSCSSVGGLCVKACCEKVLISHEKNDIAGIMEALKEVKHECIRLQFHFQKIIQLELKILENRLNITA